MSDLAIKKRISRARHIAAAYLELAGYGVIETQGEPFTVIGLRPSEARFIRVIIDAKRTQDALAACKRVTVPGNCTRELWTLDEAGKKFRIINL